MQGQRSGICAASGRAGVAPYLTGMTRHSDQSTGRRLYADPVLRDEPDMDRLVDLVLHLAESQHRAATHTRPRRESRSERSPVAESLANEAEPKEP